MRRMLAAGTWQKLAAMGIRTAGGLALTPPAALAPTIGAARARALVEAAQNTVIEGLVREEERAERRASALLGAVLERAGGRAFQHTWKGVDGYFVVGRNMRYFVTSETRERLQAAGLRPICTSPPLHEVCVFTYPEGHRVCVEDVGAGGRLPPSDKLAARVLALLNDDVTMPEIQRLGHGEVLFPTLPEERLTRTSANSLGGGVAGG